MGLKLLHSADWHLDSPFRGFSPAQRAQLKEAQAGLPRLMADLCRREGCDLVLLAGDIFDGHASYETLEALRSALGSLEVPVVIAPGNHDPLTPDGPWLRGSWPENVHIFKSDLDSIVLPELHCRIWGAGYTAMDCPGLLQDFRTQGEETWQIGLLHGDPRSLHSPYCPVTAAQVRDSGLHYLALGHVHKAGAFRAGTTLCGWPGCPMGRGYDETGEKGVYLVTLDGEARCQFMPLDTPRFYELETWEELSGLEALLPALPDRNFYRVKLLGDAVVPLPELAERFRDFDNLELLDSREEKTDPWAAAGADTLEGCFFRLLKEKMETASPEEAALYRRAAEISQKLLEGRKVELP